ncbi:MAG: glycerophosphoryl diester phosphodiesterase [Neolewinella sp.]|jgi:glycerophosphoryl diester phosphodiesterase
MPRWHAPLIWLLLAPMFAGLAGSCTAPAKSSEHAALESLRGQYLRGEHVQVVAHRGASRVCPENTIAALQRAVQRGADVVEFDVYQTRDGHWVCMHDLTCDRTTDARDVFGRQKVRIDELTLVEIQRLDAGKWFAPEFAGERVPTLQQALQAIAPAMPMIERKGGDALQLVGELQRLGVVDDVIVQSFDWNWLAEVSAAEPRLLIAALGGDEPTPERLRDLDRTGARIVHWSHGRVTRSMADAVHASGRLLCVYTVDAEVAFYGAVAVGCDLITTNRPGYYVAERAAGHFTQLHR